MPVRILWAPVHPREGMLIFWTMACSATGEDTATPVDSTPTASPWEYQRDSQDDGFDVDVLESELQDLLGDLRSYNATPVLDSWGAVRAYGDDQCPEETVTTTVENGTATYFERLCVANKVTWFKGPMTVYEFADNDLLSFEIQELYVYGNLDGTPWTGTMMKGQTDVYQLDGSLDYNCSCTAGLAEGDPDAETHAWFTYTDGPTHWTGPEDDGTWMDRGEQSSLYLEYRRSLTGGRWQAGARGSVSGRGEVFGSVEMSIALSGESSDLTRCSLDDRVRLAARQTDTGRTLDLELTLDTETSCTFCGTAVEGEREICLDLSSVNDWKGAPW